MRFHQALSWAIISSRGIRTQMTAPAHFFMSEMKTWLTPGLNLLLSEDLAGGGQPWKSEHVKTNGNSAFESMDTCYIKVERTVPSVFFRVCGWMVLFTV